MLGMLLSAVLCKEILWPSKVGVGHEADTLTLLTFCCFKTLATGEAMAWKWHEAPQKKKLLNPFYH
jgi:hypothetical protein